MQENCGNHKGVPNEEMATQEMNKVNKILTLFFVWVSMGLYLEIPGPTMIDIKIIFKATYEEVSRSVSGRGAGGFVGAIIGGFLVDKCSNCLDFLIALSEMIAGLTIMFAPYTYSINTLWFHYFILGVCSGVIGIAGIRSVITLWPEKTAVSLQLLYVGYGCGALLVPALVNPFLAVVVVPKQKAGGKRAESFKIIKGTRVQNAFVSIGIMTIILALIFFRFYFQRFSCRGYRRAKSSASESAPKKLTFKEMINPATYANGQLCYGVYTLLVLFLYYFAMVGGLEMFGQFVRSFSVEVFKFSKTHASYLNMTFWFGLTVGRIIGSLLSNYLPIRKLFMFQVLMHALSATLLNIYASLSPAFLWYCTAAEGFLISPLQPSGIAYGSTLIDISGISLMIIQFASSCGDLSFIWIAGKLYDSYGPKSVLHILQLVGIVLVICAVLLRFGERYKKTKEVEILVKT